MGLKLAIDIVDGRGLSNETRCEFLPKKTKVTLLVKSILPAVQDIYLIHITNILNVTKFAKTNLIARTKIQS